MHSNAPASRRFLSCLSIVALGGATAITTGCNDVTPLAPPTPALAVSTDGAWLVNSLADPGDGVCSNPECTFREAIAAAQTGDRITFKSNLRGTIELTAGELIIDKSLTIDGPGADVLTVDGQFASRVFRIGDFAELIVTLTGLTVTRGTTPANGGGIEVRPNARLVLAGSVVTGNSGSNGGGISNAGSLTIVGSTVSANTSVFNGAGIYSSEVLSVMRSTVSGNRADGAGGGIYAFCDHIICDVSLTLRSSTVTANDAGTNGGGVYVDVSAVAANTIIAGNAAGGASLPSEFADCNQFAAEFVSLGHVLTTPACQSLTTSPTDVIVALPQVFSVVLQRGLAANGGRVPTHALIERGPAVDAGYCPGENGDVRGFPRPYDDPRVPNALDGCDIGPFEWNPPAKSKGSTS